MKTPPLADWDRWLTDLEAERVSRYGETRTELLTRLEMERPESPRSQFVRSWAEHRAETYWKLRAAEATLTPAPVPPPAHRPKKPKRPVKFAFTERQLQIAMGIEGTK